MFGPSADLSWTNAVKVICLKLHKDLAAHYGLKKSRFVEAVSQQLGRRGFVVVADDHDHVILINPTLAEALRAGLEAAVPEGQPAQSEEEEGEGSEDEDGERRRRR